MKHFFDLLFNENYSATIFIYFCLFALPSLIVKYSQPDTYYCTKKINKFIYFIAFMVMCGGLAFANSGTDTEWYMNFFEMKKNFIDCENGAVEIGFQYYNVLIHYITNNPVIYVILTRCIMMILVFIGIYMMRDKSLIWLTVFGFAAIVYFMMFSALRNGMAYSISFLVYAYCVKRKYIIAFIFAILGIFMHRSMIMFVSPLVFYLLAVRLAPKVFMKIAIPILLMVVVIVFLYGKSLIQDIFMADDVLSGKYSGYLDGESSQGIMIFFVYLPIVCVLFDYKYLKYLDANLFYLNLYLSIMGFAFALLAYQIGQLTRVAPFYSFPFLFYIGYYLQNAWKDGHLSINKIRVYTSFMVVYWFYRFSTVVSGLFFNNGLDDYSLFTFDK